MVIVRPDGSIILDKDPVSFESVQDLGADAPTNYIVDPDPNRRLTQFVLETFNIPFQVNSQVNRIMGSHMPGYDIRNTDATTILKLSLAAELLSNPTPGDPVPVGVGEFVEIELDEFGIGRFYIVGGEQASNLDIRYCVPTTRVQNPADLVIVRGYDPPPRRELRTTFDGLKNAEIMTYEECAAGSCDENAVGKFASVSYDDPLLDQVYLDDIRNSYELQAFESLIGYIVDLDLPDGTDPDDPTYKGTKITFSDTTKEYIQVSASLFNAFVVEGTTSPQDGILDGINPGGLFGTGSGGVDSGATFGNSGNGAGTTLTVTSVDPQTGECSTEVTSIAGSKILIPASRFTRENMFGRPESDFIQVQDVVFTGRKIVQVQSLAGFFVTAFVKPLKELISLQQGKNWTWTVQPDGDVEIELFSILDDDYTAVICDLYNNPPQDTALVRRSTASPNTNEEVGPNAFNGFICNIGDRLGYMALNNRLCIVVERKRPSIDIFDPSGNAISIAQSFRSLVSAEPESFVVQNGQTLFGVRREFGVRYTPVVIVDEPSPITYASVAPLSSIDGGTTIPESGIIDQSDGIRDADPTTIQDFDESEIQILQDNTNGATIDITLPFCTDTECLSIAENFLALQNQIVTQQSVILGPTSEPKLGELLSDGSIINEISYSYSDSSQYLITVTAGPKFLSAGSFNDSQYQLQTEDVTREGVVLQDKGNGAEYIVLVEGFGETTALSMVLEEISVGDKVNVRIYNNPVEAA